MFIYAFLSVSAQYERNFKKMLLYYLDPLRTSQGMLTLKAFRLSNEMMKIYKEGEFTPEK